MTAIEVLATIFAVVVLLKLVIATISPQLWMKFAEKMLGNKSVITVVYLVAVIIVGYFIFASLNIVQIAAVMLFTSFLTGLGMVSYSEAILKMGKEMLESRSAMYRKAWLPILIWAVIAVCTLYAVFA